MFVFALAYLSLPVFMFLLAAFSLPFTLLSAVALVALVFCLFNSWQRGQTRPPRSKIKNYAPLLLTALVVTYFCTVSPFDIWDWEKHYAILNALIQNPWPPVIELNEQTYFLRYFTAWHVLPALFAKIFGTQYLTAVLFIWTATGVFIALALAFSYLRKPSHLFLAALVFFFFAGLDLIGAWLHGYVPPLFMHWPNIWISWGEMWPALTGLAWTPQHVVGGWIGTSLFVYNRRLAVKYSAVIIVMVSMWSAFPAIGLIPIALWAARQEGYRTACTPQNLLTAPLAAISIALYLLQGAGDVPFMFVWQHHGFSLYGFVLFCIFEFLLILGILYLLLKKERGLIVTLASFLFGLCLIRYGDYNDLLMRGAIPSICIMSMLAFRALLTSKDFWREIVIVYLFVGAFPVAIAFILGVSPASGRVDKQTDFKKLTTLYPYEKEEYRHVTFNYLARTGDAINLFAVPLMRGLPDTQAGKERESGKKSSERSERESGKKSSERSERESGKKSSERSERESGKKSSERSG